MSEQTASYEAYVRPGRSALWLDTGQEGTTFDARPSFEREPEGGVVDLGFNEAVKGNPVRERDLLLLRAILGHDDAEHDFAEPFGQMLEKLESERRRYDVLSEKQRQWVEGIAEKLGIDVDDPAERNAGVPRGREVAPAPVLTNLPKQPPKTMGQRMADAAADLRAIRERKALEDGNLAPGEKLSRDPSPYASLAAGRALDDGGALAHAKQLEDWAYALTAAQLGREPTEEENAERWRLFERADAMRATNGLPSRGAAEAKQEPLFAVKPEEGSGIPARAFVATDPSYTPPGPVSQKAKEEVGAPALPRRRPRPLTGRGS